MSGFDVELRRLAEELELPEPVRSRTLLELRSDLESMASALRGRGLEEGEARRRALTLLLPGPEERAALERVHRPLYQRLVDRFSVKGRHRLERLALVVVASLYLAGGLATLSRLDLLSSPSPWLWPVLALSALIVVAGAGALFQAFVLGARDGMHRWRGALVALGAATLASAFAGAMADFYGVASRLALNAGRSLPELVGWLQRDAALLSVALLAASAAGLFWLATSIRIAVAEQAEAAALGFTIARRDL
jgi:hypothetical protein